MKLDPHCHILPGLDDGAKTLAESVQLATAMHQWGFERVVCTPHINSQYLNTPATIQCAFDALKEALEEAGCPLDIRMSAEYRLVPETWPEVLEKNWIMPIEDKYVLTELPIYNPQSIKDIKPIEEFKKVIAMGLIPVLPHPERYFYLSEKELMEFVDAGVLIQCNYGSFAGIYGTDAQTNANALVEKGVVSLYATDLHNMHYVEVLGKWFSEGNQIR